jgi:S-ribosylhomocysteine lyase LuxS involved in autoinducer biosynthesis
MATQEAVKKLLDKLNEKYPLVPHTGAGRLFSMVRRMKAESELKIPMGLRTGFGISVETGKAANEMTEQEWEKFYKDLRGQLEKEYPELYSKLFNEK